jgi:hypothetical protein
MPRLRRFHPQPSLRLLHAALDPDHRRVEIDVTPPQRAKLAAAHACAQSNGDDKVQGMAAKLGEHRGDLRTGQSLDLLGVDLGRPEHTGDVPPDKFVPGGTAEIGLSGVRADSGVRGTRDERPAHTLGHPSDSAARCMLAPLWTDAAGFGAVGTASSYLLLLSRCYPEH